MLSSGSMRGSRNPCTSLVSGIWLDWYRSPLNYSSERTRDPPFTISQALNGFNICFNMRSTICWTKCRVRSNRPSNIVESVTNVESLLKACWIKFKSVQTFIQHRFNFSFVLENVECGAHACSHQAGKVNLASIVYINCEDSPENESQLESNLVPPNKKRKLYGEKSCRASKVSRKWSTEEIK